MDKELGFTLKAEKMLAELERELREIYSEQEDIFSNEHIQTRELLTVIIKTKQDVQRIGGELIPKDQFNFDFLKNPKK